MIELASNRCEFLPTSRNQRHPSACPIESSCRGRADSARSSSDQSRAGVQSELFHGHSVRTEALAPVISVDRKGGERGSSRKPLRVVKGAEDRFARAQVWLICVRNPEGAAG